MIDTQTETLIPINRAFPQIASRPHVATIWRCVKRGVRGITLETILTGGKRYTSQEAIQRFMEATTAASDPQPVAKNAGPSKARQRAIENAERELASVR